MIRRYRSLITPEHNKGCAVSPSWDRRAPARHFPPASPWRDDPESEPDRFNLGAARMMSARVDAELEVGGPRGSVSGYLVFWGSSEGRTRTLSRVAVINEPEMSSFRYCLRTCRHTSTYSWAPSPTRRRIPQ
jgi:hypothetical protein